MSNFIDNVVDKTEKNESPLGQKFNHILDVIKEVNDILETLPGEFWRVKDWIKEAEILVDRARGNTPTTKE